jgi:phage tail-like protein
MTDTTTAVKTPGLNPAKISLLIDGVEHGVFSELVKLVSEVEPVELVESTDKEVVVTKLPGKSRPAMVTVRRLMTKDMRLAHWHEAVVTGELVAAIKSCELVVYNAEGKPVARFLLRNAWPARIEAESVTVDGTKRLYETVTLACDRMTRVGP